jgi:2-isopropylmalate synthase
VIDFSSQGNGPISAFVNGMRENFDLKFTLEDFGQNTRSATSKAESAAYVELKVEGGERSIFGCGINTSITIAPILAVISAINKIN